MSDETPEPTEPTVEGQADDLFDPNDPVDLDPDPEPDAGFVDQPDQDDGTGGNEDPEVQP